MKYPQNDTCFRSFTIGRVEDDGEYWHIFALTGVLAVICRKQRRLREPKVGAECRVYEEGGTIRGCYVDGHKYFYRSSQRTRHWVRRTYNRIGLRPVPTEKRQTKR